MTTNVEIKNVGPHIMVIGYFNAARQLRPETTTVAIGETVVFSIYDDRIPFLMPTARIATKDEPPPEFFAVPPATGG